MRGVEPLTPSPGIEPANRVVDPADADPAPLEEPKASRIARYRRSGQPILGRLQLHFQFLDLQFRLPVRLLVSYY